MALNYIKKHIDLNVSQPNNYEIVHIMQGTENTVQIVCDIYDGNEPYMFTGSQINVGLTDGATENHRPIALTVYPSSSGQTNSVYFNIASETDPETGELFSLADYAGDIYLSIALKDMSENIIYTYPFIIRVTGTPIGDAQQEDISGIHGLIDDIEQIRDDFMSERGTPNGLATLDATGHLTQSQGDEIWKETEPVSAEERVYKYWIQPY